MEQFINFFENLLPILGSIVLILLALALYYVIRTLQRLPKSMDSINGMLDDVSHKLSDLDAPVKAIKTISTSVDTGYQTATKAVSKAVGKTKGTIHGVRSAVKGFFKK